MQQTRDCCVRRVDGNDHRVFKYVFTFHNAVAEAVLYRYPDFDTRTVVCCSTQSGCPVGCRFCGAGNSFVRSLTAEEIISQPEHCFADMTITPQKVQRLQIMFMSMGEPMLNFSALAEAIRVLHARYSDAALLISTSAPRVDYKQLFDLSVEIPAVGLQFSVHESTDEARDKLIPFKKKLNLRRIADVGTEWFRATGRSPFFNYCVHERNSSAADADRLLALFDPVVWQATISVICERDESMAAAHVRQRELVERFRSLLSNRRFRTRMFDPAGQDDIGGGCGQLWFVQEWMRKNPQFVRPSVGNDLQVIHTPQ